MDEPTEIFDDLYLGLRAGGALRKQRRGEELTTDEKEALGRWQRLSAWRKAIALGLAARFSGGRLGRPQPSRGGKRAGVREGGPRGKPAVSPVK